MAGKKKLEPRIGEVVVDSEWRPIPGADKFDTEPFRWGRQGKWVIMWSRIDGKIKAIARRKLGTWVLRFQGGLTIGNPKPVGLVEMFDTLQTELRKTLH